jgi:hypothetical protein
VQTEPVVRRFQARLDQLNEQGGPTPALGPASADRWCEAVVAVLGVDAAALCLSAGPDLVVPIGASDTQAATAEVVQFTAREGPCFASAEKQEVAMMEDTHDTAGLFWTHWPIYAAGLIQHTKYRSVLACPLSSGAPVRGSLNFYRYAPGPIEPLADALALAFYIDENLLPLLTLDDKEEPIWLKGEGNRRREQVWIAQGMVLQANAVRPDQAMQMLRAQAFAAERLIDALAEDIVNGRTPVPMLGRDD